MSGHLWGAVCVVAGLAMAFAGYRLTRSQERPEGSTGFEGVGVTRRGWVILAGNALLMLGLVIAVIISSFFFIGG